MKAVIKTLDLEGGHLWDGKYKEPTDDVAILIEVIKQRRDREKDPTQADYVGEKGMLDVNPSKVNCEICRGEQERLR
jgi:hypothetical protein